jgi:hypothetical protein
VERNSLVGLDFCFSHYRIFCLRCGFRQRESVKRESVKMASAAFSDPATGMVFDAPVPDPAQVDSAATPVPQAADFVDYILSDTAGVAWRAASGTVDPWTKKTLVQQQLDGQGIAGQDPAMLAKIQSDAEDINTKVLTMNGADPSQFMAGLKNSLSKLAGLSGATILIIGGVALLVIVATRE